MDCCKRCVVSGKVQGVFFRDGTRKQALKLGLKGWVRNLPNGDVECLISGPAEAVTAMCAWLEKGPPIAKVTNVAQEDIPWEEYEDFRILR